jgi:MFS family permease
VVIAGLALLSSGVFIAQTASSSHLRVAAPAGARVTAAGFYITCYYLGGAAAGVVPGLFWAIGGWPACVCFIVAMQILGLAIALAGWRTPQLNNLQAGDSMNPEGREANLFKGKLGKQQT